jgi:hypothetical protein
VPKTMRPGLSKLMLTAHVTSSVGWLGSVAAFLALAVAGLTSPDAQRTPALYVSMELIGWLVIVPFSFAALLVGLVQSLATPWGLFRHYWVLAKFVLTVGATVLLLLHMNVVSRASGMAAGTLASVGFRALQRRLVFDAGLALVALFVATALSVFKPWGRTPYGQRKDREERAFFDKAAVAAVSIPASIGRRAWPYALAIIVIVVVVVLHLTGVVGH